jgi:hypothetical protein
MSKVRKGFHGSHQQPPTYPAAEGSGRLERYLTVFNPEGEVWGWTTKWTFKAVDTVQVVLIPRLHLTPRPVYQLVHVRGYPDVFKGCCLCGPSLNFVPFQVLGAVFPFYKTGAPELQKALMCLEGSVGDLAKIIKVGQDLLT